MESDDIIALYERVAGLTGRMLAAARDEDWNRFSALETECSGQVAMLQQWTGTGVRTPLSPVMRQRKAKIISKILEDDRQIRTITEPWMNRLDAMMQTSGTERTSAGFGANRSG
ncbi:flagellar protein FliT [Oxalobacteraceae bacterium OM1]|nr:flagellar protein FliT [Oxalobacteraceae bacterium OM1]